MTMKRHLWLIIPLFLSVSITATAQSFESLKRSKGKSELYATVEQTLAGSKTVDECRQAISSGDWKAPYNGKTPIYLVMDYLATHPKQQCKVAEQMLDAFLARKDFDINLRYSTLMPPLAYLIRQNYDHLGGHFSADYISESVIRKVIEAGASVNTFNSDGGTLMSFARETNNEYLQSYFVGQGINLRHANDKGEDDTYRLIADGKLQLLQQAKQKGILQLDINTLKNEPKDFARNKPLYDFIADHCASLAQSYEDITLFRKRFADRKQLVQKKYESMALAEGEKAKDFDQLAVVEGRFPDITSLLAPKKRSIYQQDCAKLNKIYQEALAHARQNKDKSMYSEVFLSQFINTYGKRHHYDPANKVPLAQTVEDYINGTKAFVYFIMGDEFVRLWRYSLFGATLDREYINNGTKAFQDAFNIINNPPSVAEFGRFFLNHKADIEKYHKKFREIVDKNIEQYNAIMEKERASENDRKRANTADIPAITEIRKGNHGRFFDSDDNYDDSDFYYFKDGTVIEVHHKYIEDDVNYYYPLGVSYHYNTGIDAANAGWVYRKMGLLRTVGQQD